MDKSTVAAVANRYMSAWNEHNAATRESLLRDCWAEEAVYMDPTVEVTGVEELSAHIARVQAGRPGARLELVSGIDSHHNVLRFLWRLVRADGTFGDVSIDFGEVAPDGRLIKIIGFFGSVPSS